MSIRTEEEHQTDAEDSAFEEQGQQNFNGIIGIAGAASSGPAASLCPLIYRGKAWLEVKCTEREPFIHLRTGVLRTSMWEVWFLE